MVAKSSILVIFAVVGAVIARPQYSYEPPAAPSNLYETPAESIQRPSNLYETPSASVQEPTTLYETPAASVQQPQTLYETPAAHIQQSQTLYEAPAESVQELTNLYVAPAASVQQPTTLYETPAESVQQPSNLYEAPSNNNLIAAPQNLVPDVVTPPPMEGMPYDFSYGVEDGDSGNSFSHVENSDGQTTQGEYRVLLPDGRTQVVRFFDNGGGFNAEVTYEKK